MEENSEQLRTTTRDSVYRAARSIKRRDNSLYNDLRSIYQDSIFVNEISQLWPKLPLFANLRCGIWYSPRFDATCYFKSTDGHTNNLSFNTSRLNLHLPLLAGIYPISVSPSYFEEHLHQPMKGSKFDRFSILRNLRSRVNFARIKMSLGKKLCCQDGEDISVCVCLATLVSLFNEEGAFDGGKYFEEKSITKMEMRRMLIFICKYAVNARRKSKTSFWFPLVAKRKF